MNRKTLAVLLTLILSSRFAISQAVRWTGTPEQVAQITSELSPEAKQILGKLDALQALPACAWKYHSAELAHGESLALDDSSWQTTTTKQSAKERGWYRCWVTVPKSSHGYDLTGATVSLYLALGRANYLVYINGRHIAMGEEGEPGLVFDKAVVGDKALIAVNMLGPETPNLIENASLKVSFPPDRPDPVDFWKEALVVSALIPTMSKNKSADGSKLDSVIRLIDTEALAQADQRRFDASVRQAQSELRQFNFMLRSADIVETGNSHIDAAWLWPWTDTVDVVKRTFGTALQLMNQYPKYTYTQSAAQYNEWMKEKYPWIDEEIKQRIKEGRWEVVGGMWVEPDLNMPDGESIARSILLGKRWYRDNYGVDVKIGWNPDSFGYNWQLPQIYKKSGIDYFVTQKMEWNDTNQLPLKLFWWQSPDGSKVLTYFPHIYGNRNLDPVRVGVDLAKAQVNLPGMNSMMDLFGVSDHGGGATRATLDEGVHWMDEQATVPVIKFGTAKEYFAEVTPNIATESRIWNYTKLSQGFVPSQPNSGGQWTIPTWNDELYLEYHRGIFTTQAEFKKSMRRSSQELLDAEEAASLAWLNHLPYPTQVLSEAWKKVTFNQFHDIAAGSAVADVYRDAQRDYEEVDNTTDEVKRNSLEVLSQSIDTAHGDGVPVIVFNSLCWGRNGIVDFVVQMPRPAASLSVRDSEGKVLPSQVLERDDKTGVYRLRVLMHAVPSVGYEVIRVVPFAGHVPVHVQVTGTTLENDTLRVVVDSKSGCILSILDKASNIESISKGSCANELQAFEDKPKKFDAWNIDPGTLDQEPKRINTAESVRVIDKGPLSGTIRVVRNWQHSKFVQDLILDAGSDELVVRNSFDWHQQHVLLKAAFALTASGKMATYEIPYGTIERPTTRDNSFEKARFEVPALRWADLGDAAHGFSVINDSKYGYDAVANQLRISLLRGPTYPDPNADQGHHEFQYALYPHTGNWKDAAVVERGYEFNDPFVAMPTSPHAGMLPQRHSFISIDKANVILTAVKKAEDDDSLILHMYEVDGKEVMAAVTVPMGAIRAAETNLIETTDGPPLAVQGNVIHVSVHPYEIVSLRVHYAPIDRSIAARESPR